MGFFDGFSRRPKADSAALKNPDSKAGFGSRNPAFSCDRRPPCFDTLLQ
jgi:hypothetical protein